MDRYLEIFEPIAKDLGVEIKSLKLTKSETLEITLARLDSFESVDLELSSRAAQAFAEAIDYDMALDVSSEGAERVIDKSQYEREIGAYVFVGFKNPKDGEDHVEGVLTSVEDDVISVNYRAKHTTKTMKVERDNIRLLRRAVKV